MVTHTRGRLAFIESAGFELPHLPHEGAEPMVFQLRPDGGSFDPIGATYPPIVLRRGATWVTSISRPVLEDHLGHPPIVRAFVQIATQQQAARSRPTRLWGSKKRSSRGLERLGAIHPGLVFERLLTVRSGKHTVPGDQALSRARRNPAPLLGPPIRAACEQALDAVFDQRGLILGPPPLASRPAVSFGVVVVSMKEFSFGFDPEIAFAILAPGLIDGAPLSKKEWLSLLETLQGRSGRTLVITPRSPDFALSSIAGTGGCLKARRHKHTHTLYPSADYVLTLEHGYPIERDRRWLRLIYDEVYSGCSAKLRAEN